MPASDDIVARLRVAAKEAETAECLDYDPGLVEAADEIEQLRAALKPLADRVFNDNGDMAVRLGGFDSVEVCRNAYLILRK